MIPYFSASTKTHRLVVAVLEQEGQDKGSQSFAFCFSGWQLGNSSVTLLPFHIGQLKDCLGVWLLEKIYNTQGSQKMKSFLLTHYQI